MAWLEVTTDAGRIISVNLDKVVCVARQTNGCARLELERDHIETLDDYSGVLRSLAVLTAKELAP